MADIEGKTITSVRPMTSKEQEAEGWHNATIVLELDDGTLLYPSSDDEGNNGGALFGREPGGVCFGFPVQR